MALNYNTFLQDLNRIVGPPGTRTGPGSGNDIRLQSARRIKNQVERISGISFNQMSEPIFQLSHNILQQINIIKRINQGLIKGSSVNIQRSKDRLEEMKQQLQVLTGRQATEIAGDPQIDPLTQGKGFAPRGDRPQGTAPIITDPRQTSDPRIKAMFETETLTSQFVLGSTTGSATFTPASSTSSSIENPQNRSTIRINTSESGLAQNVANITINVIVRDNSFLGKTITTNVIDANTGLRFKGSTSNFQLNSRTQKVSNIVWIEKRERISGQVILSYQGQDFSRGANFEFQSTTIPDKECKEGFHKENGVCIMDDEPIKGERDYFQTAILLLLGGGLVLGMRGGKK